MLCEPGTPTRQLIPWELSEEAPFTRQRNKVLVKGVPGSLTSLVVMGNNRHSSVDQIDSRRCRFRAGLTDCSEDVGMAPPPLHRGQVIEHSHPKPGR